jgi:hypothetical protein
LGDFFWCAGPDYCRGKAEKISANTDPGYSKKSRKTASAQRNRRSDSHRNIVMQIKKAAKTSTFLCRFLQAEKQ